MIVPAPGGRLFSLRALHHLPAKCSYNSPEVVSARLFTQCQIIVSPFRVKRSHPSAILRRENWFEKLAEGSAPMSKRKHEVGWFGAVIEKQVSQPSNPCLLGEFGLRLRPS